MKALLGLLLAGAAGPALAQTVAITNATVAIGDGSEPLTGATVVMRNGRIVGAGQGIAIPAGAERIDAGGKWVVPGMIAQQDGMIVNIATAFSKVNLPLVGTYCATKSALLSLGQAMRAYLAEANVRVITVLPTTIDTDMSSGADVPKMTKEFAAAEILAAIRAEAHDPPIGDEAKSILDEFYRDPIGLEKMLMKYK